jgi:hypothetical protein
METIIKELSLNGQFQSYEEFVSVSLKEFNSIFSIFEKCNIKPLKKSNFYELKITKSENLYSFLTARHKNENALGSRLLNI